MFHSTKIAAQTDTAGTGSAGPDRARWPRPVRYALILTLGAASWALIILPFILIGQAL